MGQHVRSGDMVIVRSGAGAWVVGPDGKKTRDNTPKKVLKVIPKENKVVVEGVNVRRKSVKPTQQNPQGGFVEQAMPIHLSNVSPAVEKDGKSVPTRVKFVTSADGSKARVAQKTGEQIGDLLKKAN